MSSRFTSLARMAGGMRSGAMSITHPPRDAAYAAVSWSSAAAPCALSATCTHWDAILRSTPAWASTPFISPALAFVAHSRRSGWECSSHFSSSGLSEGMKGLRSRTSSTSAQMFPHVTAAFFLMSMARSRSPRMITGSTTASEGASMELTKVVSISLSRHGSVFSCGLRIASMMRSSMPITSGFLTQDAMGTITCPAMADTLGWVSNTHSRNAGKISGRVRMK
mmetsp:Transcript_26805/g.65682  ORF Transcript_26805/g.65682 Transcript_26805/m.65682 type:complete len:223 (-) Transcript_26805:1234-1902(-)